MNIFSSLSCAIKSPFSSSKKSTSGRSESNNNGSANGSAKPVYSPTENSKFDKLRESLRTKDTGSESSESTINTNNPPAINTGSSYLPPEPEPEPLAPIDPDEEVIEIMRKMIGQYDRMKARMAALEAEELAAQQAEEEAINKSSKKAKDELKKEEITEVKEETAVTEVEPSKGVVEEKSEEPKSAEATSTDMSSTEATSPAEDNKEGKKEPLAEAVTESTAESSVEAPPSDEEVKEVETKDSDSAEVKKEDVKDSETKVEETSAEVPSEKDSVVIEPTTVEVTTAVAVAVVAEGEKDKEIPSDDVKPAEPEQAQEVEEEQVEEEEEMGINLTRTEIETMFYFFTNLMNTGDEKTQMDVAASVASRLLGVPDLDPTADGGKNKLIDYLTSNFAKPPAPLADEDDADFNDIENSSPGRTRSLSAGGELRKSRTAQIGNEADIMSDRNYEAMDLATPEQLELMDPTKLGKWDFNIFNYCEKIATPLVQITEAVVNQLQLIEKLELNRLKLKRFLGVVQDGYKDVPYHNHIHAADVTQTVYYMGTTGGVFGATQMPHMQRFALILGAAIHDIAHPGFTGKFQVASMSELALRYNDISPLENMHLATAFALWMKPQHNFTKQMQKPQFMELRRLVIDIVLGTDNDGHFELMAKLESLVQTAVQSAQQVGELTASNIIAAAQDAGVNPLRKTPVRRKSTPDEAKDDKDAEKRPSLTPAPIVAMSSKGGFSKVTMSSKVMPGHSHGSGQASHDHAPATIYSMSTKGGPRGQGMAVVKTVRVLEEEQNVKTSIKYTPAQQLLLLKSIIHAADVSNPTKPWEVYSQWTPRIMKEFYAEGDKLRATKQPITFAFDRENPVPEPLFQMGFIRVIVSPLFTAISQLPGVNLTAVIDSMKNNVKKWEEVDPSLIKPPPAPTPAPTSVPKSGSGKSLGVTSPSPPTPPVQPAPAKSIHRASTRSSVVGTLAAQTIKEEDEEEED